mgnify:CR=1 FL=1
MPGSGISKIVKQAIEAEARAVLEGHHAVWSDEHGCFTVKSDSTDATYRVGVEAVGSQARIPRFALRFSCTCPAGIHARTLLACKHAALVARRLERMGLAEWDGRDGSWRPTGNLLDYARDANKPRPTAPVNVQALVD